MMSAADMAALHRVCFVTPRPWSEAEFGTLLAEPSVFCIDRAKGFILGRVVLDEAEVLTLAVAPFMRRRGIGAALLAGYHDAARARGAERSFLEVAEDNAAALALYERAGYARSGRRKGYYRTPGERAVDALILTRGLGADALTEN